MLRLNLTSKESARLETLYKQSPYRYVCERAQALLLLSKGYRRAEVADILSRRLDTISDWFHKYNTDTAWDLRDSPRSGRPPKLDSELKKSA